MKDKKIWQIFFIIGIVPFVFPFLNFIYEMINSSSWTLVDWLVCYSFVYWPTYIIGFLMIVISMRKLFKST